MSDKNRLRSQRTGTVINTTSKNQESGLTKALEQVADSVAARFGIRLKHQREWRLGEIVGRLRLSFPDVEFEHLHKSSAMRPDGGILSMKGPEDRLFPILIVEVKNQGTNDLRAAEGKPKQAKGNAIERLGKNVIGFRTALLSETITPFVCFGYGCDFAPGSSILDRVVTIAMFGPLNKISLHNEGADSRFNRGSFFFREMEWSLQEMVTVMEDVAVRSVQYYFSKYGDEQFLLTPRDVRP